MSLFRIVRIVTLLIVLATTAFYSKSQQLGSRSWIEPLEVAIFPINAEASAPVKRYIDRLKQSDFADIDQFMAREGRKFTIIAQSPILTSLGPELNAKPPPPPRPDSGIASIVWWGLRFRLWAFLNTPDSKSNKHRVRVFVHYHETAPGKRLRHSVGISKGLLGIVHAFASTDQMPQNNIIIAHELMHTVGARDKYDSHGEPIFPEGYGDPDQTGRYPQRRAEIMAGRIALSAMESRMATSLKEVVVGEATAREINWIRDEI
ncbi:MAG: hypothetical protein ABFS02_00115 [Pseudomonadota bacterium]